MKMKMKKKMPKKGKKEEEKKEAGMAEAAAAGAAGFYVGSAVTLVAGPVVGRLHRFGSTITIPNVVLENHHHFYFH